MGTSPTDLLSMTLSEPELVNRAARQDKRAFKVLFRKYRQSVHSLALQKTHNPADAEDIVQEVFLKVYGKLSTLKHPEAFPSWLYRVTLQVCADHGRRKERIKKLYSKLHPEDESSDHLPMHPVDQKEIIQRMRAAMDRLDPSARLLVTMAFLEGLKIPQIAERFGEPEATIRVRIYRAVKNLREKLKKQIALSTAHITTGRRSPA